MIQTTARETLKANLQNGDLITAAQIYEKNTNRSIHPSLLQKFIAGKHRFTGKAPKAHQPLQMYQAIAEAVAQRKAKEYEATIAANQLLQTILRDTKPQPIAQ